MMWLEWEAGFTTNGEAENNMAAFSTSRWPKTEVQALIRVRSGLESRFQDPGLKGPLWEEVSTAKAGIGYQHSAKRCKEKWENINKYFGKTKESGKRPLHSKTCPYFQQLDQFYSNAMGSVSLLSGQPKEGVYVEARSETKGYYEEAATDNLGNFRLRGLLPDTTYIVKVVAKDYLGANSLERASPESIAVVVGIEDIRGLDFVVFEQPDVTILSGHVEGNNNEALQSHLSVEIRLASDPSKIASIFPLPLSCYFQVRDLPKGKHLVQLKSGVLSNAHRFQSEIVEVDLEKQPQIHVGPLRYKIDEERHKLEPTPAPVFPLIVVVCVIALFVSIPRLKDLYQIVEGIIPLGTSTASIKKEPRKQVLRKRVH